MTTTTPTAWIAVKDSLSAIGDLLEASCMAALNIPDADQSNAMLQLAQITKAKVDDLGKEVERMKPAASIATPAMLREMTMYGLYEMAGSLATLHRLAFLFSCSVSNMKARQVAEWAEQFDDQLTREGEIVMAEIERRGNVSKDDSDLRTEAILRLRELVFATWDVEVTKRQVA